MTVRTGDPTFAGPLAGVALDLPVYHVIEQEVRDAVPADVFDAEIGLVAAALDADLIGGALRRVRARDVAG